MRTLFVALACAFALTACGRDRAEETMKRAEPPRPQIDASIGPQGAGGIATGAQFNVSALEQMTPGYIVAEESEAGERLITLSADNQVIFTLHPSDNGRAVGLIATRSTRARGPDGDVIGETTFGAVQFTDGQYCLSERLEVGEGFACAPTHDSAFWRVFVLPANYHGVATPFEEIDPDAALQATLAEMRWKAPPAAR